MRFSPLATLDVRFPSGEMELSSRLLSLLRLPDESRPTNFEQWHELCHPNDHKEVRTLLETIHHSHRTALSLTRRFFCGDGIYRPLRLDACILRGPDGRPLRLMGTETDLTLQRLQERQTAAWRTLNQELQKRLGELKEGEKRAADNWRAAESERSRLEAVVSLIQHIPLPVRILREGDISFQSKALELLSLSDPEIETWLSAVEDGDIRQLHDAHGRTRILQSSVSSFAGFVLIVLFDISERVELEGDNLNLRRILQRHAFRPTSEEAAPAPEAPAFWSLGAADDGIQMADSALDALTNLLESVLRILRAPEIEQAFSSRSEQIETLLGSVGRTELAVGVLGITSSGKSSLINAMMGERLLPEETRATTNMTVLCRKGGLRAVDICYEDGESERVVGSDLTPRRLEELTAERRNPGNMRGISRIEWTSPAAAIPQGLVLIDTPGIDACELPGHSELVLRRILPTLDIVLYVSSIRSPFKTADLSLMQAVLEGNQRMILLLTQIDLERDDIEGGRVILSRDQKLASYVRELRQNVSRSAIRECAIIPVSSRLALKHFYDRESTEWRASNFEPLLRQTALFREHLLRYGVTLRGRRALNLLRHIREDMEAALKDREGGDDRSALLRQTARIRELRDAQRWVSAEISSVRNEWKHALSPLPILSRFRRDVETVRTPAGLRERYQRWGREWTELMNRMTERMDRAKLFCGTMLSRHGLAPLDRPAPILGPGAELPDIDRYVRHRATEIRVRGWFQGLGFWPEHKKSVQLSLDTERLLQDCEKLLKERLEVLEEHLNWWENIMRETTCDPLYEELAREEKVLDEARKNVADRAASRSALRGAATRLGEIERGLLRLVDESEFPTEKGQADLIPPRASDPTSPPGEENFFTPLFQAIAEQSIQTRFLSLPAVRRRRRIVLLGLRRHDSLRLLSRLAHDAGLTDIPRTPEGREIGEDEWIFCGRIPPAIPHSSLRAPSSILDELDLLVAPSDSYRGEAMDPVDWHDVFGEWLPIVHLDIARVDSGLSDLARAPYASALANVPEWIAASAHGGLFDSRLSDLVLDVPERLASFTRLRGFQGRMDWFVYENYDPRYTDLIPLGRQVDASSRDEDLETLLLLWQESGLDFVPPLTEQRLRLCLMEIRERSRADSSRLLNGGEASRFSGAEQERKERRHLDAK